MNSFRGLALLVPCALYLACGVPVNDSKYEVIDTTPAPADRVVAAFSGGNASCEACLRDSCKLKIDACVDAPPCVEFAECVQQKGNPAGQARCTSQLEHVTIDTVAAQGEVRDCWVECKAACSIGRNWSCLDNYTVTQPPRQVGTVRQSFAYLCNEGPVRGAVVTYCETEDQCTLQTKTDESGSYSLDIPIIDKGPVAGWRGSRWVSGDRLALTHRLERNLPIWTDQVESTLLMSSTCAEQYIDELEMKAGDTEDDANWLSPIAVQLFDCQSAGAEGVELEVTTAPEAKIVYVASDATDLSFAPNSRAEGEGLALVTNVPPGEHELVARVAASGEEIARKGFKVTGLDLIIYSMFPAPVVSEPVVPEPAK